MDALSTHSAVTTAQSVCKLRPACLPLSRGKAGKFAPFVSATANAQQHPSASATDPSKRSALQQIALAAAGLSVGTALNFSAPEASEAYLVQFPVADLRNQYYLVCTSTLCICLASLQQTGVQLRKMDTHTLFIPSLLLQVRAGQGQCEADDYVLTNTVFKTSISNGLSSQGKRQVARQVVRLTAVSALPLLARTYIHVRHTDYFFMMLPSDCASIERTGRLP